MAERFINLGFEVLKALIVAAITAGIAYFFTKKYYSKIAFAKQFKDIGVNSFILERPERKELKRLFSRFREICIIYVSGKGFFKEHCRLIKEAAAAGTKFKILIAQPNTPFLYDIEHMEKRDGAESISTEIEGVIARFTDPESGMLIQNVEIRHFNSEFRAPLILCRDSVGDDPLLTEGFLYITLPPYWSNKSAILKLHTDGSVKNRQELDMVKMVEQHFDSIWENPSPIGYWRERQEAARAFMDCRAKAEGVLIECAAQHPLIYGEPNDEYRARLDRTIELFSRYADQGLPAKICVLGSVHRGEEGCAVSLSAAGRKYLLERGIPEGAICKQEDCEKKGGVYNSADECYVAAKIFREGDFARLICVCSPTQALRKQFLYIANGVIAECETVGQKGGYHDVLREFFFSLGNVVYDDHTWQNEKGQAYLNSRKERKE